MKKQYIFILLITILLYIIYLIIDFKYSEYKTDIYIDEVKIFNSEIKDNINDSKNTIDYILSPAYRNWFHKSENQHKNKGEEVIRLTKENRYNKYTKELPEEKVEIVINKEDDIIKHKTIKEKWNYMLFEK